MINVRGKNAGHPERCALKRNAAATEETYRTALSVRFSYSPPNNSTAMQINAAVHARSSVSFLFFFFQFFLVFFLKKKNYYDDYYHDYDHYYHYLRCPRDNKTKWPDRFPLLNILDTDSLLDTGQHLIQLQWNSNIHSS